MPASAAARDGAGARRAGTRRAGRTALAKAPAGEALKLKPIRIGLYDQYGGIMPSGWTRWLFEQYEFPFQVVYPATLDAGDLKSKFDVLVFTDGAMRRGARRRGGARRRARRAGSGKRAGGIPRLGWAASTEDKTVPQLKSFVEAGGTVVTIGSSTSMAELFGIPVKNYLTEMGAGRQGARACRARSSTFPAR